MLRRRAKEPPLFAPAETTRAQGMAYLGGPFESQVTSARFLLGTDERLVMLNGGFGGRKPVASDVYFEASWSGVDDYEVVALEPPVATQFVDRSERDFLVLHLLRDIAGGRDLVVSFYGLDEWLALLGDRGIRKAT